MNEDIIVIKKERKFTLVDNEAIQDASLSWEALGLFVYLEYVTEIDVNRLPARGADKEKLERMIRELAQAGYLEKED